jgi:hypothetical protein
LGSDDQMDDEEDEEVPARPVPKAAAKAPSKAKAPAAARGGAAGRGGRAGRAGRASSTYAVGLAAVLHAADAPALAPESEMGTVALAHQCSLVMAAEAVAQRLTADALGAMLARHRGGMGTVTRVV